MIFLIVHQLWATEKTSSPIIQKEVEEQSQEDRCSKFNIEHQATQQAISFYETVGLWANVFTIGSVLKTRVEYISDEYFVLHLRYLYTPIPNNVYGRKDVGTDQRTFHFFCRDDWVLERMGEHMSAEFPS